MFLHRLQTFITEMNALSVHWGKESEIRRFTWICERIGYDGMVWNDELDEWQSGCQVAVILCAPLFRFRFEHASLTAFEI